MQLYAVKAEQKRVPGVPSSGRESFRSMHLLEYQEDPGLYRIRNRIQTSSGPICQVGRPARHIAHIPRSYHARSSPMEMHHIQGYGSLHQIGDVL